MRAILFDIDGTLTATTNADNGCYERAFEKCFGFPLPTTDWHCYQHVTDVGIIDEVFLNASRAKPLADEIACFEVVYEQELADSFAENPAGFAAVPGSREILNRLTGSDELRIALATGGMRRTALFKLRKIDVDGETIPGAFANDAISRADIARIAIQRLGVVPSDVVYVGDGAWDVATAAELGMRFIGISREYDGNRLRNAGAGLVLDNYIDQDAFLAAIENAPIPSRPR